MFFRKYLFGGIIIILFLEAIHHLSYDEQGDGRYVYVTLDPKIKRAKFGNFRAGFLGFPV